MLLELINEISLDMLRSQFVDTKKISSQDFAEIEKVTAGKTAYATWLASKVANKIIKPEDISKYKEYFAIFDRRKKEYPFQDIGQYKDASQIASFIEKTVELKHEEQKDISTQKGVSTDDKYRELYLGDVEGYKVYKIPKGRKDLYGASCELGSGTEWCTATGNTRNHFDSYISGDDLYIFIKGKDKYQFSYKDNDFMDKNDNPIL